MKYTVSIENNVQEKIFLDWAQQANIRVEKKNVFPSKNTSSNSKNDAEWNNALSPKAFRKEVHTMLKKKFNESKIL
jgi:hypothetical protein